METQGLDKYCDMFDGEIVEMNFTQCKCGAIICPQCH